MAYRTSRSNVDFDDRDTFYSDRRQPMPRRDFEDDLMERRSASTRAPPRSRSVVRDFEDSDARSARFNDVRVRERSRSRDRESRLPNFMRNEARPEAGPMVLRQRDVETFTRDRPRSPSPPPGVRYRASMVRRSSSLSPGPPPAQPPSARDEYRPRYVEREREKEHIRSPSVGPEFDRMRARLVGRERSPTPPGVDRVRTRRIEIERERPRSPTPPPPPPPPPAERERIAIMLREREREREPSPSPSPPPPPPEPEVIKGPTIEREVITHYRDIDHGMIQARPPSPPPAPRSRNKERETDIDIHTSRGRTDIDIDIDINEGRNRARSASRARPRRELPPPRPESAWEEDIMIQASRNRVHIDIDEHRNGEERQRRSRSVAPPAPADDEGEYITRRIDERGRPGEAWHGITKDWTIVDVPPGTERVRMDGAGGGGTDVTWQKYSGVRRAQFVPERDSAGALVPAPADAVSSSTSDKDDIPSRDRDRERERLSVQIYDKHGEVDVDWETGRKSRRRRSSGGAAQRNPDMWTEITKDLVMREAIIERGYAYEETEYFYYVMEYLKYDEVLELVKISDSMRRQRRERARDLQWEREYRDDYDRRRGTHRSRKHYEEDAYDDGGRWIERERDIIIDRSGPPRGYYR